MFSLKLISIFLIFGVTLISGSFPFLKRFKTTEVYEFPLGESLAAGVFLGAGLIHMLGEASRSCYELNIHYPLPFFLTGITFLFFLLFEHVTREVYQHEKIQHGKQTHRSFAVLAVLMLSIHGLLTGAALGLSTSISMTLIILAAILAHQWAESFALAIQINKSDFSLKTAIIWFVFFALMVPVGIIGGAIITNYFSQYPLLVPIFSSLSAGTFLYLGTLHGLESAILVKECCDLRRFMLVIVGFLIMAVVALWA